MDAPLGPARTVPDRPDAGNGHSSTAGLVLTGVVPVETPVLRGAAAAAAALLDLPVPARWTWTVEAGGGRPPLARLDVRSIDRELTEQARATARVALEATLPWLLWADDESPTPESLPVSAALVVSRVPPTDTGGHPAVPEPWHPTGPVGPDLLPALWAGISCGDSRTRLSVSLTAAAGSGRPAHGTIHLASTSGTVLVTARLLAAASSRCPGDVQMVLGGSAGAATPLDVAVLGGCLAVPALLPGAWPTRPATPALRLLDQLTRTEPPHTVVFGGSGLGKTTLLEALVEHNLATGRATVVLDPHGDLAARAAVSATALGVPVTCLDFGDTEQPPPWNLSRPPAGVGAREWVSELLAALQGSWADADPQWFGPVYRRAMASLLLPLVSDPEGPWPLTRVPDLAATADPADPAGRWRLGLRSRIQDRAVRRDLDETVRMLADDREGSARPWLLSKLEPLLQHPGMRRVLDTPVSCLDDAALAAGRPLLVSAPASALGDEGSTVISLLLLRWIWNHVRRHGSPAGGLDVVLDEAQRMPVALCREILAEGRKYGLQLRLATQSPGLLAGSLRTGLLTNAGSVATFRLGAEDAVLVRSRFRDVPAAELCELGLRQVAVASTTGETAIGAGPPGRALDAGRRLRELHRQDVAAARTAAATSRARPGRTGG